MTLIIISVLALILAYGIIRSGAIIQKENDRIRQKEYQKRNDLKGK